VAKEIGRRLHITGPARRDIVAIVKRSLQEFGKAACLRYTALIRQALLDIAADPQRPGSSGRPEVMADGARTYHISHSRARVSGSRVKEPRHFLLYRCREDGLIEVARILHDSRDLERHLPEEYQGGGATSL
jgi:toxin ParE1/3/4